MQRRPSVAPEGLAGPEQPCPSVGCAGGSPSVRCSGDRRLVAPAAADRWAQTRPSVSRAGRPPPVRRSRVHRSVAPAGHRRSGAAATVGRSRRLVAAVPALPRPSVGRAGGPPLQRGRDRRSVGPAGRCRSGVAATGRRASMPAGRRRSVAATIGRRAGVSACRWAEQPQPVLGPAGRGPTRLSVDRRSGRRAACGPVRGCSDRRSGRWSFAAATTVGQSRRLASPVRRSRNRRSVAAAPPIRRVCYHWSFAPTGRRRSDATVGLSRRWTAAGSARPRP